jgi:hypothetical protein
MGLYESNPAGVKKAATDIINAIAPNLNPGMSDNDFFALETRITKILRGFAKGTNEKDRGNSTPPRRA